AAANGAPDLDVVAVPLDALFAERDGIRVDLHGRGVRARRVRLPGVDAVGADGLDVVGLADADGAVAQQVHLLAAEVDELEVLWLERADDREAVDGPLVQRDKVLPAGRGGVALHGAEMADVVV